MLAGIGSIWYLQISEHKIEQELTGALVDWQLHRLPRIDRDILQIAVAEIALQVQTSGANLVVFNRDLSPAQIRNLENQIGVRNWPKISHENTDTNSIKKSSPTAATDTIKTIFSQGNEFQNR